MLEGDIAPLWAPLAFCLELAVVSAEVAGGLSFPGLVNLNEASLFTNFLLSVLCLLFLICHEVGRVVLGNLKRAHAILCL